MAKTKPEPKSKWYAKLSKKKRKTYAKKNNQKAKKRIQQEEIAPSRAEYYRDRRLRQKMEATPDEFKKDEVFEMLKKVR